MKQINSEEVVDKIMDLIKVFTDDYKEEKDITDKMDEFKFEFFAWYLFKERNCIEVFYWFKSKLL